MNAPTLAVRAIAAAIAIVFTATLTLAQPQVWAGHVMAPGAEIGITVRLDQGDDGVWSGTLDIPGQAVKGAPLDGIVVEDARLAFRAILPGAPDERNPRFELDISGDSAKGTAVVGGGGVPVVLERTSDEAIEAAARERRPQTPRPPFVYRTQDVRVPVYGDDGEVAHELAGTLTLPETDEFGDGPYPCVVTISGTGAQDRDETIYEHKPFAIIADHLARRGVASLRCDDRGVGESGGDYRAAACTDFAADARAQVEYLRTLGVIDHEKIGLIGHSEGGLTAPLVAADNDDVAFVVLLAGMAVRGDEVLTSQSAKMFELLGLPESFISESNRLRQLAMDAIREDLGDEVVRERLRALVVHDGMGMMGEEQADAQTDMVLGVFYNAWGRELVTIEPTDYLARMTQPVLAITGSLDTQVLPGINLAAQRGALEKAGNEDATVVELEGLNHLFQNAQTGAMAEYATITETFDEDALAMVGDWIVQRTR